MLGFIFDHISEKVFNFMFIVTLQHQPSVRPAGGQVDVRFI
tara:strand:- start:421 stop:543 length:123 start_codon:yes stop_codon:yes gene_type:complete